MECPYCGARNHVHATVGSVKTVCCLNCRRGHHTHANTIPMKRLTLIDFGGLQDEINIMIGKRTVTLAAIPASEQKTYENLFI
jgi:hypothetical protein